MVFAERVVKTGVPGADHRRFGSRIERLIDGVLSGSLWKWKALFAIVVLSLFHAFPSYDALRTGSVDGKWQSVQVKFDHPLADTSRIFAAGSHESNLTFRLTVPILAHTLHLRRTGLLILSGIAGLVLLYCVLHRAYEATASKKLAVFTTLTVACVWPGQAAFHELRGGYYDALALCLLLLAFRVSSWLLTAMLVFVAGWTDERALIASSFLFILPETPWSGVRTFLKHKPGAVLTACALYLGARAYLTVAHSYSIAATGVGPSILLQQVRIAPFAMWTGLGGCWGLIILALLTLFFQRRYVTATVFCGVLTAVASAALLVVDVTRSMAYCLPAVFVALSILGRTQPVKRLERITAITAGISFAIPSFYLEGVNGCWWLAPLPLQIGRWLSPVFLRHPF